MLIDIIFIVLVILIFWAIIARLKFLRKEVEKQTFMEETPITVFFSTKEYTEEYYTLDDFDFLQEWLYKKAQLGEAANIKIVLEENAGFHKDNV